MSRHHDLDSVPRSNCQQLRVRQLAEVFFPCFLDSSIPQWFPRYFISWFAAWNCRVVSLRRAFQSIHRSRNKSRNQVSRCLLRLAGVALLLGIALWTVAPSSGPDKFQGKGKQPDFIPAGYNDYQNMLDQLGIKKMRKGRNAQGKD